MNRFAAVIAVFALCATSIAQTTRPATLEDLKFALGGEWKVDAKWANGTPLRAVVRFEYLFDGRFIRGESFRVDDDGTRVPRELVIFSINNAELVQTAFNADGNTRTSIGQRDEDGSIVFESSRKNPDGSSTPLRQRIQRIDDSTCRQTFMMNIRGEWHTLIDAEWKRTGS